MTDELFKILSSDPKVVAKIKAIDKPEDLVGFLGRRCIPTEAEGHPYANITRALALHSLPSVDFPALLTRLKAA